MNTERLLLETADRVRALEVDLYKLKQEMGSPKGKGTWEEVARFAVTMEQVLNRNNHKTGWDDMSYDELMVRMREEIKELSDAIDCGAYQSIIGEAADVANFLMFIAERARQHV